jgi:hypothetical protein
LSDLNVDGRIILTLSLKYNARFGLDLRVSRLDLVTGYCEYDNEPYGSIKGRGIVFASVFHKI